MHSICDSGSEILSSTGCESAQVVRQRRKICGDSHASDPQTRRSAGTPDATTPVMAAVLALVMLPIIASVGFFIGVVRADGSLSSALAGATFVALAIGVLGGALRIALDAERESPLRDRHGR